MSSPYSVHRPSRSRGDAVRLFCLECVGSSLQGGAEYAAVRDCPCALTCSLYPYRFGTDPKHRRSVSEATLKALTTNREKRARTRGQREDGD